MIEQELQGCCSLLPVIFCSTPKPSRPSLGTRFGHPYPILIRDGIPKLLESAADCWVFLNSAV